MKVVNLFFEDRYGGPQKRAIQVAREIRARGVSTIIVLPEGSGNADQAAAQEDVATARIDFCRTPRLTEFFQVIRWAILLPFDIVRFVRYYRLEAPDVAHVNGAFFIAPALAAKISGIPVVWHLNDTIVPGKLAFFLGWLVRVLANEIVVAARAVARHYCIPDGKYTVIFAPVDIEKIQQVKTRKHVTGAIPDAISIGLIANWSPIKGVEFYVQAAALLRDRIDKPLRVLFAGQRMSNVEYCRKIEQLIDACGLRPHVVDLGFIPHVEDFLAQIDVLVMSSTTEACPMSVLEAMAAGIPVVATDVGGTRELLLEGDQKAGIIVPARDASAIADALMEILQSPDVSKQMGTNGRRFAERKFSLDVCANRHVEVYRSACGQRVEGG